MLTIAKLTFTRGGHCLALDALTAVAGEHHVLVGKNGAGKSILLRLLVHEITDYQGDIHLHQQCLREWPRQRRAQHIAMLPQTSEVAFPYTAAEVVAIGATPLTLSQAEIRQQAKHWMKKTHTDDLSHRLFNTLSGGEQQRVHFARVLLQLSQATRPPLLLLDEPISAQDIGQQHALFALLTEWMEQQQAIVVTVLHDLNQALRYGDRVWLLDKGRLQAVGKPSEVLTPQQIESVWGYRPQLLQTEQGYYVVV
ncbi:MAG TPA: hemin ABC transporter ATP-binding protein [Gammaproteobacteria bacterium]|nr:hemin ABC transporter ATP-binding protein [Gammaproteobacteria bacterium]